MINRPMSKSPNYPPLSPLSKGGNWLPPLGKGRAGVGLNIFMLIGLIFQHSIVSPTYQLFEAGVLERYQLS